MPERNVTAPPPPAAPEPNSTTFLHATEAREPAILAWLDIPREHDALLMRILELVKEPTYAGDLETFIGILERFDGSTSPDEAFFVDLLRNYEIAGFDVDLVLISLKEFKRNLADATTLAENFARRQAKRAEFIRKHRTPLTA